MFILILKDETTTTSCLNCELLLLNDIKALSEYQMKQHFTEQVTNATNGVSLSVPLSQTVSQPSPLLILILSVWLPGKIEQKISTLPAPPIHL